MKIIGTLLLLSFLIVVGIYLISDPAVPMPAVRDVAFKRNNFNNGKSLIPERQVMVSPFVERVTLNVPSTEVENPHLPIVYSAKYHDNELVENDNNIAADTSLEEGQSRTFLYSSSHDEAGVLSEFDNAGEGYFLQPGQSRTFLPLSDEQNIPAEDK